MIRPFSVVFIWVTLVAVAPAQTDGISPEVKNCVQRATAWLLKQQTPEGCFSEDRSLREIRRGSLPSHSAAMTSLAVMGLASVGHLPSDATPEGRAAASGLRYVLENVEPDEHGYMGRSDRSRMYGHGIITLMMTEMIGQAPDEQLDRLLQERIGQAVRLILRAQSVEKSEANRGGWRYEPASSDSDISVSVWQLMSLRAAKSAGFDVPKEAIEAAIAYIKRSYQVKRDEQGLPTQDAAAFSYEPYGGRQTFSTTAAGLLSLQVAGDYEALEVKGSANWLLQKPPEVTEPWFYYGTYYYAQGMYQRGGEFADAARRKTEQMLVTAQNPDGSFFPRNGNEKSAGAIYATALSLLSLSVHYHFLPIYQK